MSISQKMPELHRNQEECDIAYSMTRRLLSPDSSNSSLLEQCTETSGRKAMELVPRFCHDDLVGKAEFDAAGMEVLFKEDVSFYVGETWFETNGRRQKIQQCFYQVQGVVISELHCGLRVLVRNELPYDLRFSAFRGSIHSYSGTVVSYSVKGMSEVVYYELNVSSEENP